MKDSQPGIPVAVFWLLAIWVVLVLAALVWGVDNAETKVRHETRAALEASGVNLAFDISGRDVTLFGEVDSEEAGRALVAEIDDLPGVRGVRTRFTIVAPVTPQPIAPVVSMRIIGDAVSIRGSVPSTDVSEALIAAAAEQYGAERVVDALIVNENVEARPWLGRIKNVFAHLGELRSGGFVANNDGFTLSGDVISETVRSRIEQDAEVIFDGSIPVISNLEIAVLPLPTFHAESADGALTLSGSLPDQDTAAGIVDAARRLHPGATIINNLRVAEVAGPLWLESIDGLLDVVTRLDPWTIDIADGAVSITGLTLDEDQVAAIAVLADEVVAGQLTVTTDVGVDPAAVAVKLTSLLAGTEMFPPGETTISTEGQALLDQAIQLLDANPGRNVVVAAYTDDQGDEAANLELSQQQAEAVVAYMVAGGVDVGRLSAIGYGEAQPIADNNTADGRARNRRIEFAIEEGDG